MTGRWTLPSDPFYSQLGIVAVSMFFMITGYLFWGKLIKREGRIEWAALYIGRIFRIAPVYWIAVTGLVFIVFWRSGFELREPLWSAVGNIAHWYGLGLLIGHDFNGYENVWIIVAGVVWTLKYEWRFYLALLPAAPLAKRKIHLPATLIFLVVCILGCNFGTSDMWQYLTLFGVGMLTASLRHVGLKLRISDPIASVTAIAVLVTVFVLHPRGFGTQQALLLGVAFLLICNGATIFGLLTSTPAIRLGHVSYGIYLLQGFVFSLGFDNALVKPLVTGQVATFWMLTLLGMLALCATAALIFVTIERPMIGHGHRLGKQASTALKKWRGRVLAKANVAGWF